MRTFFRVLRYADKLKIYLPQFVIFTLLSILFSAFNIAMVTPLLEVLFDQVAAEALPGEKPSFSLSLDFIRSAFQYYFVTIVINHGKIRALMFVCVMIIISVFITNLFRYLAVMIIAKMRNDVIKNLRMDIFGNVTLMHIGYFGTERKGDMISRITNDIYEIEVSILNGLKGLFQEPLTMVVFFVFLFIISPQLTLFTLLILPLLGGAMAEIIKRLKRQAKFSQESLGRIVNILDETLGGMRVIKAFNARPYVMKKIDDETDFYRRKNLSIAYKNQLSSPLSEFLGVIIVSVILYFGGTLVLDKESTLNASQFITFLAAFAMIISPAKAFSNGLSQAQKGIVSANRIFQVIDQKPAIRNKENAQHLEAFRDNIQLVDVSFAYEDKPVLSHIDLMIEKGKTIALVGPSGAGKSTLADLIPRFYDPGGGSVLLDGIPLTDYDIESLRAQMGIVTQESILFNDTIFNNIAFGIKDAQEEEVIRAAKIANAHNFIMETEQGYQTNIGERGSKLSGGQRQRLSIARAIMKNPAILILDEATSALDSESEQLVQDALTNLMANRTSVVIAHRLSTIQHADEIIVLQDGKIVERGTHQELVMKSDGMYRKLSALQNT